MRKLYPSILFIVLVCVTTYGQTAGGTVAFVVVNVIPMDRERVLQDQTVLVRHGKIVEIGAAAKIKVPKDAVRVEGKGKFLIPGLVDMHTHLMSDEEFPDDLAPRDFIA